MLIIYRKSWKLLVLSQVFVLLSGLFLMLVPAQVSNIVNYGLISGDINSVLDSAALMVIFAFISGTFTMLTLLMAVLFAEGTANFLRTRAYSKVQRFSFKNLDACPTDEFMGIGGVVISREEKNLLKSMAEALGVTDYHIEREPTEDRDEGH